MSYWLREIAGWLLTALGVYIFWLAYQLAVYHLFLEVWAITIFGIFIFRGGIHLLKVAIAARICREAQHRVYPAPPPGVQDLVAARPSTRGSGLRRGF
jgi:hypothetical protein